MRIVGPTGVRSMIPRRELTEGIMLGFSHRSANARHAPWPGPAGGWFRPRSLLTLRLPHRACRIASWPRSQRCNSAPCSILPSPSPFPMPRSVTPILGKVSSPRGPNPATGKPRLLTTATVVRGRAILHTSASASAFGADTINPVPPFLVARPTQSGGRPNPSLQRTRYARR